jgi:hypothetical protein
MDVISLLYKIPDESKGEMVQQVRAVLGRKNFVEYDDRLLPRQDSEDLVKRAGRIVERARRLLGS